VAKWMCACGSTLRSSGAIPNPGEWLLVSDTDFDGFSGLVQAEDVHQAMTHAFRCAKCDRLHIFRSGLEHEPIVYTVDNGRDDSSRTVSP